MAGLYIHIPFCASRCIYCGFYSTTMLELRSRYVDALCREISLQKTHPPIETIYLGGGTPSQLSHNNLLRLFTYIYKVYPVASDAEVTIECNPDDISPSMFRDLPVNRVSMGAQTFDNQRLSFLHRRHTASQVSMAVQHLRNAGICNISIDLIYGFPHETLADWANDIEAALALNVEHISAYCLSIEEGTPLHKWATDNGEWTMDEELERKMYELLIDKLAAAGYEHYEISNFARPGFRSRHNSSYWQNVPYIGIGAAAHSYDGKSRSWNVSDLKTYMEAIERRERPYEEELIDDDTHYNDCITTALRTCEGLDLTTLSAVHRQYCEKEAQRFINGKLLRREGDRLILTRQGLFVSDYVMSSLIYI